MHPSVYTTALQDISKTQEVAPSIVCVVRVVDILQSSCANVTNLGPTLVHSVKRLCFHRIL